MKHSYKKPKFDLCDAVAMECWLADLAKQGLIFAGTNLAYFRFLKAEPAIIRYRVEPMIDDDTTPSEEIIAAYKEAGWEFVSAYSKLFFVWKSTDENAMELHTDPIVQSESYKRICKKLINQAIASGIATLIVFAMFLGFFIFSDRPVLMILANPLVLALFVSNFFAVIQTIMQASRALKLKKMLADGFSIEHKKDYHKQYLVYRIITFMSYHLYLIFVMITIVLFVINDSQKSVVDAGQLPFIPLDIIEQSEEFEYKEPFYFNGDGVDYNNHVQYNLTLLVLAYYDIYQVGAEQSHKWPDGSGYYSPSANTEYYRLSIESFAPLLFEELMDIHLWEDEEYIITEIDAFERTVIAQDEYMKHLFVLEQEQVFYLRYYGYADLNDIVPLLAEILSEN